MAGKTYRVIQWATGTVGKAALKYFIENPAIELVGVYVTSPEKVGRVAGDIVSPRDRLVLIGQFPVQHQPAHIEEVGALGQLLDRVPAIAQDALVTIDESDRAAAARSVLEGRVIRKQSEVVVGRLDLP